MKVFQKTNLCFILIFAKNALEAKAQEATLKTEKRFDLGVEGMIGASIGRNFYAFNVGGPSFRLRITRDLKIGVGALPFFYFKDGKAGGKLGVSPRVDYRKFVLIAPFFHFESSHVWVGTIGIGYNFGH